MKRFIPLLIVFFLCTLLMPVSAAPASFAISMTDDTGDVAMIGGTTTYDIPSIDLTAVTATENGTYITVTLTCAGNVTLTEDEAYLIIFVDGNITEDNIDEFYNQTDVVEGISHVIIDEGEAYYLSTDYDVELIPTTSGKTVSVSVPQSYFADYSDFGVAVVSFSFAGATGTFYTDLAIEGTADTSSAGTSGGTTSASTTGNWWTSTTAGVQNVVWVATSTIILTIIIYYVGKKKRWF